MQFKDQSFHLHQSLSLWLQIHLKFQVIELLKSTKTLQNVAQTTLVWFQSFAKNTSVFSLYLIIKQWPLGTIYYKGEQMQGTEKKRPYFYVRQFRRSQHCNFYGSVSNHYCKALFAYERSRLKEGSLLYVRIHSQVISMNISNVIIIALVVKFSR